MEELFQELREHPEEVALQQNLDITCDGNGDIPSGTVCYSGSFLTEQFFVQVKGYSAGQGTVSMWAKGPKSGHCAHRTFTKEGTAITIEDVESCGLSGMEYTIDYCSNEDTVNVNMVKPMTLTIVLKSTPC